jgi:hypothetical protein
MAMGIDIAPYKNVVAWSQHVTICSMDPARVVRVTEGMGLGLDDGEYFFTRFEWGDECGLGVDDLLNTDTDVRRYRPRALLSRAPLPDAADVITAVRSACEDIRAADIDDFGVGAMLLVRADGALWADQLLRGEELHSGWCSDAEVTLDALEAAASLDTPLRARLRAVRRREMSLADLEAWIYATPELETELGAAEYLTVISIDYRDEAAARTTLDALGRRVYP